MTRISTIKRLILFFAVITAVLPDSYAAKPGRPEFFVLDNGVGRGSWTPIHQAETLSELGYDGISYNYTNPADLAEWLIQLKAHHLTFYGLYFNIKLGEAEPFPAGLQKSIPKLKGSRCVLWVTLLNPKTPGNYEADMLKHMKTLAGWADESGLRVVIYPHFGFSIATTEQALSLADSLDRPNVSVTVNLAHELAAGNGPRLKDIVQKAVPRLSMMTINGASDIAGPRWGNYIKPLDEGTFDVAGLIQHARNAGYTGPVGLQAYGVTVPPEINLKRAISTWNRWTFK